MILPSQQVNALSLANALRNAFIEVADIEETCFQVKVDELFFEIRLTPDHNRLNLQLIHNIAENTRENALKLIFASNEANKDKTFAKTSIVDYEDRLFLQVEYTVRYDKGLHLPQFVSDLRFFERVTLAIIGEHFRGVV